MRGLVIVILAFSVGACQRSISLPHASPQPTGELVPWGSPLAAAVNEYFHYRKLAIVQRDIAILWSRFPELRTGEDLQKGVNVEGQRAVRPDAAGSVADVIYEIGRYERMRATISGDEAVVRVNVLERYIRMDFSDDSASEFVVDLYMRREPGLERWSVVRTDEMTLAEYHEWRRH